MSIPHYINENKSDMRGIKSGWYTMDEGGKLSFGPFSSREECLSSDTQPTNKPTTAGATSTAAVKQIPPYIDRR
jgi:hypothetical protein